MRIANKSRLDFKTCCWAAIVLIACCSMSFVLGRLSGGNILVDAGLLTATYSGNSIAASTAQDRISTTSSTGAIATPASKKGWASIDVFFGNADLLSPPDSAAATKKWFSQVNQDEIVATLLRNKRGGFFIDLAANHATHWSNTFGLEKNLDWNGLCMEPNPMYWRQLAFRRCQVVGAVVGGERDALVHFRYQAIRGGAYGRITNEGTEGSQPAYTVPLLEVLERYNTPREIDYLSLDVEGAESLIITRFPLNEYKIKVITVERLDEEGMAYLQKYGYVQTYLVRKVVGETLWVHESVQNELDFDSVDKIYKLSKITHEI